MERSLLQSCVIQVAAVFHANKVRDLEGIEQAAPMPSCDLRRHCLVRRDQLVRGHVVYLRRWIRLLPWRCKQRMVEVSKVCIHLVWIFGPSQPAPVEPRFAFLERKFLWAPSRMLPSGMTRVWQKPQAKSPSSTSPFLRMTYRTKGTVPSLAGRNACGLIPIGISYVIDAGDPVRRVVDRRIEDDTSGRDPFFFRSEIGLQ